MVLAVMMMHELSCLIGEFDEDVLVLVGEVLVTVTRGSGCWLEEDGSLADVCVTVTIFRTLMNVEPGKHSADVGDR